MSSASTRGGGEALVAQAVETLEELRHAVAALDVPATSLCRGTTTVTSFESWAAGAAGGPLVERTNGVKELLPTLAATDAHPATAVQKSST